MTDTEDKQIPACVEFAVKLEQLEPLAKRVDAEVNAAGFEQKHADTQADYINNLAKKKGLKVQVLAGGYGLQLPGGSSMTFKTRAELISYLKDY
jgi:hypothetical protein